MISLPCIYEWWTEGFMEYWPHGWLSCLIQRAIDFLRKFDGCCGLTVLCLDAYWFRVTTDHSACSRECDSHNCSSLAIWFCLSIAAYPEGIRVTHFLLIGHSSVRSMVGKLDKEAWSGSLLSGDNTWQQGLSSNLAQRPTLLLLQYSNSSFHRAPTRRYWNLNL